MANRYPDWLKQADADLAHARISQNGGSYEWSCFASHQAAEKALKALFLRLEMEAWGHTLMALLGNLPEPFRAPEVLVDRGKILDRHYIPTRYPNGFDSGAPTDFYTTADAEEAIQSAEMILEFCRDQIRQQERD